MSKKAQKIRRERLEMLNQGITTEAEKIFDWILNLIDEDTKKKYFGSVAVCLFEGQTILKTKSLNGTEYDLTEALLRYDKIKIFKSLKKVVESEKGFKAILKLNDTFYDSKAIIFEVFIV